MKNFQIGQRATTTRTFTANDLREYRALSGALTDDTIPGPLLGGMFSFLLGTELPGRGTNYLKQKLAFLTPARVGEAITATVEITRVRPDKDLVNLRTMCVSACGEIVCEGEALVLVKDVK
jgi:acyl dehydratase